MSWQLKWTEQGDGRGDSCWEGLWAPRQVPQCENHRITESLRLEKTSKIIKSNHHPSTTMPAQP